MPDPRIRPAGFRQILFLRMPLDQAKPILQQKWAALRRRHLHKRIGNGTVGRPFSVTLHGILIAGLDGSIRTIFIAPASGFVKSNIPVGAAGIRTFPANTSKFFYIFRLHDIDDCFHPSQILPEILFPAPAIKGSFPCRPLLLAQKISLAFNYTILSAA